MKSLAVQRWPGPTPTPQDGIFAILIDTSGAPSPPGAASTPAPRGANAFPTPASGTGPQRDDARRQIRLAAREALAVVLRMPATDITVASAPGTPPHILLAGVKSRIGISLSHDDGYALAAINLHGPIGADIMRVQDIPDWQAVARDYLGPAIAAALQNTTNRPLAFTQAWTQREAALKCHAQQLSEWQAELTGSTISLILPAANLAGHIHIGDKTA
ncbi:4'-phosphopantetheinyl transferase superfamily protein [Duganella sp. FT109W]|uniref:4'-phosphopantetheinyl transferase superfamily protein n=1 Tax=Duganella margarita TaxID=2692170 RepID=A0ABW9WI32_9BURK|nr:4'-phosphopantetheinyl transferase superfamily protein [Duganella margarita]MYN40052.1 4'-phosphopantetheinyl transferase superfamily protein [Duganella margarita]